MTVEVLYKYGMLGEFSEALFATPNVWFASPASLNDPFECRPWFTFEGSEKTIVTRLARGLHQQEPHLSPDDAMARAFGIYREGRHRNPETWEGMRAALLLALADDIGIYCLSATNNSILMWSHYADEHRGYCLGFEAGDTTPFFGAAQEVRYSDTYPVVDVFTTTNSDQVDLIFLTKFSGCHMNPSTELSTMKTARVCTATRRNCSVASRSDFACLRQTAPESENGLGEGGMRSDSSRRSGMTASSRLTCGRSLDSALAT